MKKKILICGASGFIGRNLVEFYIKKSEYEVFGTYLKSQPFNLPGLKLLKVDLRNKTEVEAVLKGKEIIIQAAATTSGAKDITNTPYLHVTDNAVMNSLISLALIFIKQLQKLVVMPLTQKALKIY